MSIVTWQKCLMPEKDEGAIAEFATAVHLDPTNQDALRSHAGYLIALKDYRGTPGPSTPCTLGKNRGC